MKRAFFRHPLLVATFAFATCCLNSADASAQENTPSPAPAPGKIATSTKAKHVIADLRLELMWIEPGSFVMGSSDEEAPKSKSEGPQTTVTLTKGFWLGRTEVTQAQYETIIGTNPSTFKDVGPDAPVERVSWQDAMRFCQLLTERERAAGRLPTGHAFSLPTEAQWEYAYRAGTTSEYPQDPLSVGWFEGNSGGSTHPVAMKSPNAWGLHDLAGNVVEWCVDWFENYPGGNVTDPRGPKHGHYRMARGGSWRVDSQLARSAARGGGSEGRLDYTLGFRIALNPLP